ncbi:hypothetical protein CTAYLR_007855 [Chrysophaeum taylorii]|uniref:peptidyl-tRNA hydrolase n=1 Tax=Chrysophaeum taylorii TaxID=2483200 RepID=A0AAD7UCD1_9STRA|nr:hypothetical protein CTAYLR_007855 [Chrysophaeum taylorii]
MFWTGFSSFGSGEDRVDSNPTAVLAEACGKLEGSSCAVVEVSMAACDEIVATAADSDIVVHLGVASQSERIMLEAAAYNETSFRVPDERGAQPVAGEIESGFEPKVASPLDVEAIVAELRAQGHDVAVSEDPGRFVCNYLYFKSLRKRAGRPTLFVHTPPFDAVPESRQLETLRCLRTILARRPSLLDDLLSLGVDAKRAREAVDAGCASVEAAMDLLFREDDDDDQDIKMVLVVRSDISMSPGKIAAQSCHAALGAYRAALEMTPDVALRWVDAGEKVVVARSPPTADATFLAQRQSDARNAGLPAFVVSDAGRTEVAPGTETVLAVGPGDAPTVDTITKDLRLL